MDLQISDKEYLNKRSSLSSISNFQESPIEFRNHNESSRLELLQKRLPSELHRVEDELQDSKCSSNKAKSMQRKRESVFTVSKRKITRSDNNEDNIIGNNAD